MSPPSQQNLSEHSHYFNSLTPDQNNRIFAITLTICWLVCGDVCAHQEQGSSVLKGSCNRLCAASLRACVSLLAPSLSSFQQFTLGINVISAPTQTKAGPDKESINV